MSILSGIEERAAISHLYCAGIAPVFEDDGLGPDCRTIVLLGPDESGFWNHFTVSSEYGDGLPDPLDRWSRRVIGRLACDTGTKAVFPFDGPPYRPFIRWAARTGRVWQSPVGMQVHERAGLFFSVRGAIVLTEALQPSPGTNPCLTCQDQPCRTACPVDALATADYDLAACHSFLDTDPGQTCMVGGCLARRACPVGQGRRQPEQSAYHMKAFHPE